MKSSLYLHALKLHTGISSDNGIAKLLGLSRAYIGSVKAGRVGFGNCVALKIAEILGVHPAKVIAECSLDRAETPEERIVWRQIARCFDAEGGTEIESKTHEVEMA